MFMGINSATANYSCLWCKIHKNNRWDKSKCFNFYHQNEQKRTLEDIENLCSKKSDNYGCINPPLISTIKIDLDHVVPNELHLLLRITDRLLQNVIDEILERDAILDFNKPRGQAKAVLLNEFVKDINELGVTFNIWYKKNADGSASTRGDFRQYSTLHYAIKRGISFICLAILLCCFSFYYAVFHSIMLFHYVVFHSIMPFCISLCCFSFYYAVLYFIMLFFILLCRFVFHYVVFHSIMPFCISLCCFSFYYAVLYFIMLFLVLLCCFVFHYAVFHYAHVMCCMTLRNAF
jgi:hypothetical protein